MTAYFGSKYFTTLDCGPGRTPSDLSVGLFCRRFDSRESRAAHNMAKAYVGTARLEPTGFRSPRSRRGWHVRKERQRKRGTTRRSPRRSVHSEGISYKPLSGEIGMCLRVGRMGPVKRGWTGTQEPGPERGPLG